MTTTVNELISALFAELRTSQRIAPFIKRAEEEGHPGVAKMLRAMTASERVREALMRTGIAEHAEDTFDYYVCPHCGLIFAQDAPEKCPVDDTLGAQFERIS
jgi:rubrerythrin